MVPGLRRAVHVRSRCCGYGAGQRQREASPRRAAASACVGRNCSRGSGRGSRCLRRGTVDGRHRRHFCLLEHGSTWHSPRPRQGTASHGALRAQPGSGPGGSADHQTSVSVGRSRAWFSAALSSPGMSDAPSPSRPASRSRFAGLGRGPCWAANDIAARAVPRPGRATDRRRSAPCRSAPDRGRFPPARRARRRTGAAGRIPRLLPSPAVSSSG